MIITEALATRTPVIVSNLGGMAERIRHGVNGLVFEVGSVESLTRQLQGLLEDPRLLPRLKEGIEPVRTFDNEMTQLVEIYCSLVSRGAD